MTIGSVVMILFLLGITRAIYKGSFNCFIGDLIDYAVGLLNGILVIGLVLLITKNVTPEVYTCLLDVVSPIKSLIASVWNFKIF